MSTNLDSLLDRLERTQLVHQTGFDLERNGDSGRVYSFKNVLVQDAAYGSLLMRDRRGIHWADARAYEHLLADRAEDHAAILAHHFAEAGFDGASTAKCSLLAGDDAYRMYAYPEAIRH